MKGTTEYKKDFFDNLILRTPEKRTVALLNSRFKKKTLKKDNVGTA